MMMSRLSLKNRFVQFLIFTWIVGFSFSMAQPNWAYSSDNVGEVGTIDYFQNNLSRLHKSPHARLLKQAQEALNSKDYVKAIRLSASSLKEPTYMDYGLWISAQADRGLAELEIAKNRLPQALKLAEKSIFLAEEIESKCPYSPFLKTFPVLLAHSEIVLAEIHWNSKKWPQAESQYENAFQRLQVANSLILLKPENLSHYTQICKKNETSFCVSWLKKLTTAFSKQQTAVRAIADVYDLPVEKHRSFKNPVRVTTVYKSLDLDAIAFEAAMKLYFEEKYGDSVKAFEQLLIDYPRTSYRTRVRYWLGQAAAHDHNSEKSEKIFTALQMEFPLTYYGLLASRETKIPIGSALSATLPMAEAKESSLFPQEIFHLRRAENFIAENANDLAAFELRDFKPRDSFSSPFLVYLAMLTHKAKCYTLLFSVLSELLQRGSDGVLSSYGLHLVFPLDYFDVITKKAAEVEIDPILVLSLIKQESSFDKGVSSPVGAMGLMQLMPYTALETDPKVVLADLLDSDENIRVGILYLNKLLNKYNGNIVYALGAYNAGPNAMGRWIKAAPKNRNMFEFIESITYRETREYVAAIIRNYFWYSRKLKGEGTLNFDYFWNSAAS